MRYHAVSLVAGDAVTDSTLLLLALVALANVLAVLLIAVIAFAAQYD